MIRNYLKIAARNLTKNSLFSSINILGMAIGLASFFTIGLFVWDEWKFDRHIPDASRTFRVYNIRYGESGETSFLPIVPVPFATYMQKDFPEIENTMRMADTYAEQLFEARGKKIMEGNGLFAEAAAFDMLGLMVISGNRSTALERPRSVALSESLAKKYFSAESALGELIKIDGDEYAVTAIYRDPPEQFHVYAPYLLSFSTISQDWKTANLENWQFQQYYLYVKLRPHTDANLLEAKLLPFVEKYAYPKIKPLGFTYVPHLQNVLDIHLHSSNFQWDSARHGNAQMVYVLSVTAVVIMLIACLNFVNLSTARSLKRMKEVGVRKVVGAMRRQLIVQFTAESVVVTMTSLVLAVGICEMGFPSLNAFAEKHLVFPMDAPVLAAIIAGCLVLGTIAGAYPSFHLSRFRPAVVLYNRNLQAGNHSWLRQGLVIVQFMLSFFLILASMIVLSQTNLLRNKDLGFLKEQLVTIPLREAQLKAQEATKREFSSHRNVLSATICFGIPGDVSAGDEVSDPYTHKIYPSTLYCVDRDYVRTLGMRIVAGHDFVSAADEHQGFILNETAARTFGLGTPSEAIGKPLDWKVWGGKDSVKHGFVAGIVQDFHFKSLREEVTPVVIQVAPRYAFKLVLRIKPVDIPSTMAFLRETYSRLDPQWSFTYQFVDQSLDKMYRSEEKLSTLFTLFTGLAIAVACMGLFGLVEYSVNQRTKEISIRKVFGASVHSLLLLLTRKYFALILVAFATVVPLTYYTAGVWLDNFAYRIQVTVWMYVEAAALIFMITALTVCFQSLKAAHANPANTLRND